MGDAVLKGNSNGILMDSRTAVCGPRQPESARKEVVCRRRRICRSRIAFHCLDTRAPRVPSLPNPCDSYDRTRPPAGLRQLPSRSGDDAGTPAQFRPLLEKKSDRTLSLAAMTAIESFVDVESLAAEFVVVVG
jgi:hypothetical protein